MGKWYIGNLNLKENRREKNGVTYYVRGVREVEGRRFERYAVKTHFVERGEDYIELVRRYVLPIYQPGDIVSLGEKVISMCQDNTVEIGKVRPGFWAKFLSKFATRNQYGIGMDEPYKLQLAINMKGLPRILLASFCGAVCRLFGVRGVFYRVAGRDVAGIDGFYKRSAFNTYHTLAVLTPRDPDGVCEKIERETGIICMIADASDLDIELLGRSPSLRDKTAEFLCELIGDNPSGQDDELTPFIIIRDIGDAPAEDYKPVEYLTEEEYNEYMRQKSQNGPPQDIEQG